MKVNQCLSSLSFVPGTSVHQTDDEDQQEKAFCQLYDHMPEGMTPLAVLRDRSQRKQLGKGELFFRSIIQVALVDKIMD